MDLQRELDELDRNVVWTIADHASFEQVLQSCDLNTTRDLYHEIDRDTACQYLIRIFFADLAYDCPQMSFEKATSLAEGFLAEFPPGASRYYSNGTAEPPREGGLAGVVRLRSWNQVGSATFDWGVLVVGTERSGCVWALDED